MGRAQFEYDEVGNTFYYVVVSFYAVILVPLTYIIWPSYPKEHYVNNEGCQCKGCRAKRDRKRAVQPWEHKKRYLKVFILLILWALFIFLSYKVSQIEHTHEEYDPYKILGLDNGADVSAIKKAYHGLSKKHHPDRGGDEKTFDLIAKAYQALTNDEARENWEKYGNPDGPKATTFGIALPKWIVSDQYGGWVLGLYVVAFMLILPILVWVWWSQSSKYSADKVLFETSRSFYQFLYKTPSMNMQRAIMVLSAAHEFWKKFNAEVQERDTDEQEVKPIMKEVKIGDPKKEPPFYMPWNLKARTLLLAHLSRITDLSPRLKADQEMYLKKIIPLCEEFIRMHLQMHFYGQLQRPPTVDTLTNLMTLPAMFVQALWPQSSPLLQLPHFDTFLINVLRRRKVFSCTELANLNEFKRRKMLSDLNDSEYEDVITVLKQMPSLEVSTEVEVQGEDDKHTVTAGSVVTLKVTLNRFPLLDPERRQQELEDEPPVVEAEVIEEEPPKKRKVWEKPQKKKKGASKKKSQQKKKSKVPEESEENGESVQAKIKKEIKDEIKDDDQDGSESEGDSEKSDADIEDASIINENDVDAVSNNDSTDDEGDHWDDGMVRKEALLEREPTDNHEVHAPYYPLDKYEWWYLYLLDKKTKQMIALPISCKTLKDSKTVELRFAAPQAVKTYLYTLHVLSDSYLDASYQVDVKIDVHPAREPEPIKYADTEDEVEGQASEGLSEYTEGSDSEED
uniref:J domain-containing protein n=1 Tax=Panagrolaimus sp. JU765 TaxID=591449 RepID=A0AC34R9V4_9BILA